MVRADQLVHHGKSRFSIYMTMYYSIAGHILEIITEEPGCNIPGFSSFTYKSTLPLTPLVSIELGRDMEDREVNLLYQFIIEKGTCYFSKCSDDYLIRWVEPDGTLWLMEIAYQEEKFVARTNMNEETDNHIMSFSIWIAFGISALYQQTVAIHASAVIHKGRSILFLGESGTGKSTQTSLWLKHIQDTELLNDDSPFISIKEGISAVWGSPWSGKSPCYKDKCTPVAAFIRLRQASSNSIKHLRTIEAIGALQPSLPPIFASEPELSELILDCLSAALKEIPVYMLDCLPNEDAVKLVYATLRKDRCI